MAGWENLMNLAHMPKLVLCGCLALGVATGACSAKPPPAADAGPTDSGLPPIIDSGPADSGPVDSGPVDAGIQLSLSDFESTYVQTLCGMLTRCQIGGTLDLTACEAEQAAITSSYNGLSTIEGLLDAGVVAYNPVFGNSCIQDLVHRGCRVCGRGRLRHSRAGRRAAELRRVLRHQGRHLRDQRGLRHLDDDR